jgi:alpha-beta hydrolase superfamily lysophospholipase
MTLTTTPPGPEAAVQSEATVAPSESTARMTDGTLLRTLRWSAPGDPWARVLLIHGIGEHAGRYGNVARPLAEAGLEVHGYDHRGFGGSAGRRAYVERWSQYHDDLAERIDALRAEQPAVPMIVYGHSLGGLIAAGYVLSGQPRSQPDLLVLSAPAVDAVVPRSKRLAANLLIRVTPKLRLANGALGDGLSHDPVVREAYERDPLCQPASTVRLGHELFAEQARVQAAVAAIESMPMPTYVLHGSEDPLVPPRASAVLGTKGNVTRRVHDGLRHECHHEPEHADVFAEVVAWLELQRAALAAAVVVPGAVVAPGEARAASV